MYVVDGVHDVHAMLQHSMLMTMLIPLISPLLLLKWQRLLRCWLPWRAVLPLYLSLNACGDAVGAVQHVVVVVLDRPPMGWMVVVGVSMRKVGRMGRADAVASMCTTVAVAGGCLVSDVWLMMLCGVCAVDSEGIMT